MPEQGLCEPPCGYSGRPESPFLFHMPLKGTDVAQGVNPGFYVNTRVSKLSSICAPRLILRSPSTEQPCTLHSLVAARETTEPSRQGLSGATVELCEAISGPQRFCFPDRLLSRWQGAVSQPFPGIVTKATLTPNGCYQNCSYGR